MYVVENTLRGARVEDGGAVEARSVAFAAGKALPCPAASPEIGKGARLRATAISGDFFAACREKAYFSRQRQIITTERQSRKSSKARETMTPKELLYVEDALGHTKEMQTAFSGFAAEIQDTELKSFVEQLAGENSQWYSRFVEVLNKNA